jgi:hypothetical protein
MLIDFTFGNVTSFRDEANADSPDEARLAARAGVTLEEYREMMRLSQGV